MKRAVLCMPNAREFFPVVDSDTENAEMLCPALIATPMNSRAMMMPADCTAVKTPNTRPPVHPTLPGAAGR